MGITGNLEHGPEADLMSYSVFNQLRLTLKSDASQPDVVAHCFSPSIHKVEAEHPHELEANMHHLVSFRPVREIVILGLIPKPKPKPKNCNRNKINLTPCEG